MTAHVLTTRPPRPTSWTARALEMFWTGRQRERAINELEALTDERLSDIGVDRCDIARRIDVEMGRIDLKRLGQIGLR